MLPLPAAPGSRKASMAFSFQSQTGVLTGGQKIIDFVLAYEEGSSSAVGLGACGGGKGRSGRSDEEERSSTDEEEDVDEAGLHLHGWRNKAVKRHIFEANLKRLGLQLEHVKAEVGRVGVEMGGIV
jgi:hypothetical protein